jgi:hypothetical protein
MLVNRTTEGTHMSDVIDRFTAAIEGATIPGATDVFAPDAVLDATVPNWRFAVRGRAGVSEELATWYADPGQFESLTRTDLPGGATLVQFVLTWEEQGEPHMSHQAHLIEHQDGRITLDTVWCGGRWDSALMAQMAEASAVHA